MKKIILFLMLLVTANPSLASIKFQVNGQLVQSLEQTELLNLDSPVTIEVFEPHELQTVRYMGWKTRDILQKILGPDWIKNEEVLFTCSDGYQASIPVANFLAHDSYLVYEREGSKEFELINSLQLNEKVNLGPFYLVWDNINDPVIRAEGASLWPYQVVAIDFVSFKSRFGLMAPDAKATRDVKQGFLEFRKACSNCHKINGVGGDKSIELNYPLNVTEYYKSNFLPQWIDQPQSVRHNSIMPPFNPTHPDRKGAILNIIKYLKHMAKRKPETDTKK